MAAQGTGFWGLPALLSLLEAPEKASEPRTEAATRAEPHRGGHSFGARSASSNVPCAGGGARFGGGAARCLKPVAGGQVILGYLPVFILIPEFWDPSSEVLPPCLLGKWLGVSGLRLSHLGMDGEEEVEEYTNHPSPRQQNTTRALTVMK